MLEAVPPVLPLIGQQEARVKLALIPRSHPRNLRSNKAQTSNTVSTTQDKSPRVPVQGFKV